MNELMKKILKWAAAGIAALVALAMFQGASEMRQWFAVLVVTNIYLAYMLSKQVERRFDAIERRLEVLFRLSRALNGFHDDDDS